MNLSTMKVKQQIKIFNRSKTTILCRYNHLFDSNSVLLDSMNIIKVIPNLNSDKYNQLNCIN